MGTKSNDIEAILAQVREAAPNAPNGIWVNVRRARPNADTVIEFPSWLSELWLLDGHWAKGSARYLSADQFISELEAVLALVSEPLMP